MLLHTTQYKEKFFNRDSLVSHFIFFCKFPLPINCPTHNKSFKQGIFRKMKEWVTFRIFPEIVIISILWHSRNTIIVTNLIPEQKVCSWDISWTGVELLWNLWFIVWFREEKPYSLTRKAEVLSSNSMGSNLNLNQRTW